MQYGFQRSEKFVAYYSLYHAESTVLVFRSELRAYKKEYVMNKGEIIKFFDWLKLKVEDKSHFSS